MVRGEITAVRQQPVHNNWHLWVCVRNSQTENQQRWYSCVVRCYLTIYQRARRWNHPDTSWQSLYQQHLNLNKVDLVDLLKSHQRPSSMGNCTNRSTESPWAHHLGHCSPMFSWDPLKKLLSVKAKCLNSTRDTLMIRLPICWTQHQRLLFFRSWTTATLQLISLRKRKSMACFFFSECIVWTEHHKSRPKFTSDLPTRDFCSTTTAMLICAINVGCWKPCLIVHIAYRLAGRISLLNVTDCSA